MMLDIRFKENSQEAKRWAANVLKAMRRGLLRATDAGMRLVVNETIRRLRAEEPQFMRRRTSGYAKQLRGRARKGRARYRAGDLIAAEMRSRRGYMAALERGGTYEQVVGWHKRTRAGIEHEVRRHKRTRTERVARRYLARGARAARSEIRIPYERAIAIALGQARAPKTSELYRGLRGARIQV